SSALAWVARPRARARCLGSSLPPPSTSPGTSRARTSGTFHPVPTFAFDRSAGAGASAGPVRRRTEMAAARGAQGRGRGGDFASYLSSVPSILGDSIDVRNGSIRVVIGNEAGDADSIISALGWAYVKTLEETAREKDAAEGGRHAVVPVVSVPRADLALRRDVLLLLDLAGIDAGVLLCTDNDVVTQQLLPATTDNGEGSTPRTTVTLVDHNRIRSSLSHLSSLVSEIADHHEDEGDHGGVTLESGNRIVAFEDGRATVASTCTLVTERLLKSIESDAAVDGRLGLILLGVILLDSVNMLPAAGKGTPCDQTAISALLERTDWSSLEGMVPTLLDARALGKVFPQGTGRAPDQTGLFEALSGAKNDPKFWDEMSGTDCLRIDYKLFSVPPPDGSSELRPGPSSVSSIGLSSVLLTLDSLLSKPGFGGHLASFVTSSGADLFGVLAVTFVDGAPRRELLLAAANEDVVDSFAEFLTGHPDAAFLELVERDRGECADAISEGSRLAVRVFAQGNGKGSRKQVAPVLLRRAAEIRRPLPGEAR
ncbi:hypothetical protein ACHAWF_011454, partial [Thalassiosira exigua]